MSVLQAFSLIATYGYRFGRLVTKTPGKVAVGIHAAVA